MNTLARTRKTALLGAFVLLPVLLLMSINIGQAQRNGSVGGDWMQDGDPPPLPDISTYQGLAEFTFEQLGHESFELNSPDTHQFSQDFPYRWEILGGISNSYIEIHYDLVDLDAGQPNVVDRDLYLPTLEVQVEGVFAGAFVPQEGLDQIVRIPIPAAAVIDATDNSYRFRFLYYRGVDCIGDLKAKLVVYDDSTITIRYGTSPVELKLIDFPRPLVQESFIPESLQIVVPDDYSEHDLTVASLAAASIGNRAVGNLTVNLLTASEARADVMSNSSVVIVGRPDTNEFLAQLYALDAALPLLERLPTRLSADGSSFIGSEGQIIKPDDGILQLARSSFNPEHTFLIITGLNDEAVMRAVQSLRGARPSVALNDRLAVIEEFEEDAPSVEVEEVGPITLGSLGLRETPFYGIGSQSTSVSFFVPHNWNIQKGAALHLYYIHSSQLSTGYSSLSVDLNGEPVGSAPIDTTKLGEQLAVIPLPVADIRLGEYNRLTFSVILNVRHDCVTLDSRVAWLRIREHSFLDLPFELASRAGDLKDFSNPFYYLLSERGVSSILISLPPVEDRAVMNGMIRFAHLLGEEMRNPNFDFVVSTDAGLLLEDYSDYHVVAFGRPTSNPLIKQLNDDLPQPFVDGQDTLGQDIGNIVYRLPVNFSMGVIEVFASPLNSLRGITIVSGTTDEGLSWALDTYTDRERIKELDGDITLIIEDDIEVLVSKNLTRYAVRTTLEDVSQVDLVIETVAPEIAQATSIPISGEYAPQVQEPPISTIVVYEIVLAGLLIAVVGTVYTVLKRRNL